MAEITVYTKDYCPYCTRVKDLFKRKGASFKEVDITNDPAMQEEVVKKSGGRKTVPQVFIDGKPYGGFDDVSALDRDGKLDALILI